MSDYTKATNFTLKDGLTTGDPQKIIKGSELDAEYTAISNAVSSKADLNNPTFTGSPAGPTPTPATDSSNKLATTSFVQDALQGAYPVGSIYMNATVATNPSTLLGFGTWIAFGAGKVPVGLNAADSDFNTVEETGGSKDAILPSHTHVATVNDPGHNHTVTTSSTSTIASGNAIPLNYLYTTRTTSTSTTGITVSNSTEGESATGKNLQPYVVVYMWKRTV